MIKVYFLSSCSTCKSILKTWNLRDGLTTIDIKKAPLDEKDLKELYSISNNYEVLFNKRAIMVRDVKKKITIFKENDYKKLLLSHYSFLKRPVLLINKKLFIGNSKETVSQAVLELKKNFN